MNDFVLYFVAALATIALILAACLALSGSTSLTASGVEGFAVSAQPNGLAADPALAAQPVTLPPAQVNRSRSTTNI